MCIRIITIKILISLLFLINYGFAQSYIYGGGPNAFYKISFSPRETAMGGTGVASSAGPFAAYYNPSNIISKQKLGEPLERITIGFISRTNFFKNQMFYKHDIISHNFDFNAIAFSFRPKKYSFMGIGFSLLNRFITGIDQTTININDEITKVGEFTLSESLFMLTPALYYGGNRYGTNIRFNYMSFPGIKKPLKLAGFDVGTQLNFISYIENLNESRFVPRYIKENILINIDDFNFGMTIFFDRDNYNQSLTMLFGYSIQTVELGKTGTKVLINFDFIGGNYLQRTLRFGTEIGWKETAYLRLGTDNSLATAVGAGIRYNPGPIQIKLDISYSLPPFYANDNNFNLRLVDNPLKLGLQLKWAINRNDLNEQK